MLAQCNNDTIKTVKENKKHIMAETGKKRKNKPGR